jgi:hypothetical protein
MTDQGMVKVAREKGAACRIVAEEQPNRTYKYRKFVSSSAQWHKERQRRCRNNQSGWMTRGSGKMASGGARQTGGGSVTRQCNNQPGQMKDGPQRYPTGFGTSSRPSSKGTRQKLPPQRSWHLCHWDHDWPGGGKSICQQQGWRLGIRWRKIKDDKGGEDGLPQLQAGLVQGANCTADAAEGPTEGRNQSGLSLMYQQ